MTPSALEAEGIALSFMRNRLSEILDNKISKLVTPEDAAAFKKAGAEYGMASQYEDLRSRMQTQSMQSLTPTAELNAPSKVAAPGLLGKAQSLAPGSANRGQMNALNSQISAIENLQQLVEMNSNAAFKPVPRSWSQIRMNMSQLTNVGTMAMQLGLVGSIAQLVEMPDETAKKIVGAVAAAMPTMFQATPDKVNAVDGELQSPMDADVIKEKYRNTDPLTRAMHIGATFDRRYLPSVPAPQMPPMPPLALPSVMEKVSKWSREPLSQSAPIASSSPDMLSQMEELTRNKLQHANDT